MFALEISFKDGVSDPELIFVRRQSALVGASPEAHVEVQDMQSVNYQLRLTRDLGRRFRCKPVPSSAGVPVPPMLEGVYMDQGTFDVGQVKFVVLPLDSDLQIKDSETLDRAGVRILRQACASAAPAFPALVVLGEAPVVWSFVPNMPVYVGTSKECALRLENPEISARHALIGYESGQFWVEDLGSTNGTFVMESQVSGRTTVPPGQLISLGRLVTLVGVTSEEQLSSILSVNPAQSRRQTADERRYPVLISISEVARPARMVMPIDASINIGRDPGSDIWLGAPHVSRRHCSIALGKTGEVAITDHSTNGTSYDEGVLRRGDVLRLHDQAKVLDFGGGVTLAICFNEEQERQFTASGGSPTTFRDSDISTRSISLDDPRLKSRAMASRRLTFPGTQEQAGWQQKAEKLGTMYRSLGLRSKITFLITLFAVLVVLVVIFNLIIHISF
ncbi:MAG: FHA domain-containing protein [Deltaproteobacteria bacterium]|nr:FHA domain-containing protein [Deltaproteobacteria bacterium]